MKELIACRIESGSELPTRRYPVAPGSIGRREGKATGCVRIWLEYIRYRFRLNRRQSWLELAQAAALEGLRNSDRCLSWRVLPAPDDASHVVLEIEWNPGAALTPFQGSDELAAIHSALSAQAHPLGEGDYHVDRRLLRQMLGAPDALFGVTEDIVAGVLDDPLLRWRFRSDDGSRRGRLGLWLLEVLGGPDLFSSSFPDASVRDGPLACDRLDLEERERLLEIASDALPTSVAQGRCVLGNLRSHLPLHPAPRSRVELPTRPLDPSIATPPLAHLPVSTSAAQHDADPPDANELASARDGDYQHESGVRPRADADSDADAVGGEGPGSPSPSHRPRSMSALLRSRGSGASPRRRSGRDRY